MGGIIWLASYPKSGNTWMRSFLHNLLLDPQTPFEINKMDQFTLSDSHKHWFQRVLGREADGLSMVEVAKLAAKTQYLMTQTANDTVFVKTHNICGTIQGHPMISLENTVGVIHIVRNPLDVIPSVSDHFGHESLDRSIQMLENEEAGGNESTRNVRQSYGSWSMHTSSWINMPIERKLLIRYEDMLSKPIKTFAKVAKFLGVKPPKKRLLKAIKFSSFKELEKQEQARGFRERSDKATRFFRHGKSGQYKNLLTTEQIDRVKSAHNIQMSRLGYL